MWALHQHNKTLRIADSDRIKAITHTTVTRITACAVSVTLLYCALYVVNAYLVDAAPPSHELIYLYYSVAWALVAMVIAVVNIIVTRKHETVILHFMKLLDNANALIALALAQKVIFYYAGLPNARLRSGIGGILLSSIAGAICLVMLRRYQRNRISRATPKPATALIIVGFFIFLMAPAVF